MPLDLDRLRSIGAISKRSGNQVREGRHHPETGEPYKATKDELGNVVTQIGDNRQDVQINAPQIALKSNTQEIR